MLIYFQFTAVEHARLRCSESSSEARKFECCKVIWTTWTS